jgi:MFS family permease
VSLRGLHRVPARRGGIAASAFADRKFRRAIATYFCFAASVDGFLLFPVYVKELGMSELAIGFLMALYSASSIGGRPLVGQWIDRVGRRPAMSAGAIVSCAAALVATMATTLPALAAVRVAQGIGAAAFFAANLSFLVDVVPPHERGRALSLFGVAPLASAAVTPLVGEVVVRHYGFPWLFGLCALLASLTALLARRTPETRAVAEVAGRRAWSRESLQYLWRRPVALTLSFGIGSGTLFAFAGTYSRLLGVENVALFYVVYGSAGIGVRLFGGGLIDRRGRRNVIVPSLLAQIAGVAVLGGLALVEAGSWGILPALAAAALAAGAAHGYLFPSLIALFADEAPYEQRGFVISLFGAAFGLGQAVGPAASGYVAQGLGYGPMWTVLGALLVGGWVLSLGLVDPTRGTVAVHRSRERTVP